MGVLRTVVSIIILVLMIGWYIGQVFGISLRTGSVGVKLSAPPANKGVSGRKGLPGKFGSSGSLFELPFNKDNLKIETGIEFLRDWDLDWDDDYWFGTEPDKKDRRNMISTWVLVQKLLRAVKGLPNDIKPERNEGLVSGRDFEGKPEWCFQTFDLHQLVKVELSIYAILKKFDAEEKITRFPALYSYLDDIEHSTLRVDLRNAPVYGIVTDAYEDPYLYVASHPILVYRLIRRFSMDLQPILLRLKSNTALMYELYEYANPKQLVFPNRTDLMHALQMVKNAQYGNMLDIYEFARGKFDDVHTGIQLNALHAIEIGTYYLQNSIFDGAVEWMHYAFETIKQSPQIYYYPLMKRCFLDLVNIAIESHNKDFLSKKNGEGDVWWDHDIYNNIITPPFDPRMYVRMVHLLKPYASKEKEIANWNWAVLVNFKRVCAGENLQSEAEKAYLKCWYDTSRHAYWKINPLKVELLHKDPPVLQMYDFIGPKLMKKIKAYSVPRLRRSQVADNESLDARLDYRRTSSGTWFSDYGLMGKQALPLTRKLEYMSGLRIYSRKASEDYQVASYGPSHFYEVHHDGYNDERRSVKLGNRITTIMAYLSNVAVGGKTGFPVYGFAARPIKGSILMWNNLQRNGMERDRTALHGACPVALGIKWITNKWILYNDNMLTYRCTLNPYE